jgi:hypothetical protein
MRITDGKMELRLPSLQSSKGGAKGSRDSLLHENELYGIGSFMHLAEFQNKKVKMKLQNERPHAPVPALGIFDVTPPNAPDKRSLPPNFFKCIDEE